MSKPLIALTIATLTCAGASAYFWSELQASRGERAKLQDQITRLEHSLANRAAPVVVSTPASVALEPRKSAATTALPQSTTAVAAVASPALAINAIPNRTNAMDAEARGKQILESYEQQLRMLKDPEYRELMRTQQKMSLQRMYNDLEPLLGLTADESDRLLDALAEQTIRSMEQRPSMLGSGGGPLDDAAVRAQQQRYADLKSKNDAEVAQVLGSKFKDWQAYQNNGWSRSQVMRLRQTLSTSDEPLRQDQVKSLVEAIAYEQKQLGVGVGRNTAFRGQFGSDPQTQIRSAQEWLEQTSQSQQRIQAAVSGLLTPRQLEQLQQQHSQELKMIELNVKQQRARAEAQARGEIPADPPIGGASNAVTFSTD